VPTVRSGTFEANPLIKALDVSFAALSNSLFRSRTLLELLLFKLEVEQLLLSAGSTRWLSYATREVEAVLSSLREGELDRAIHAESVADSVGLPHGATLGEIADAAPSPWDEVLRAHRTELQRLVHEIAAVADTNRDLLARQQATVAKLLTELGPQPFLDEPATYSRSGNFQGPRVASSGFVNRII
jgi:hypothetical protein